MPSDEHEDGFMDRMAKRLFASPDSPFTRFADQQRIDRLEQCRQLERALKACQSANDEPGALGTTDVPDERSRARIARFYKWKESEHPESQDAAQADPSFQSDGESHQSQTAGARSRRDCSKETHELWACRALALGCGGHVRDLRQCWMDAQIVDAHAPTGGEGAGLQNGTRHSCQDVQMSLASCVNKRAAELAERVQAAKKQ